MRQKEQMQTCFVEKHKHKHSRHKLLFKLEYFIYILKHVQRVSFKCRKSKSNIYGIIELSMRFQHFCVEKHDFLLFKKPVNQSVCVCMCMNTGQQNALSTVYPNHICCHIGNKNQLESKSVKHQTECFVISHFHTQWYTKR